MRVWVFLLLSFMGFALSAQSTDEQLANQYYAQGEWNKAEGLFQKLLTQNPKSGYFYQHLLTCLIKEKKFDEAIRVIKKTGRKNGDKPLYMVDQCWVYQMAAEKPKFEKTKQEVIKSLSQDDYQIRETYQNCMQRGLYDLAGDVLKQGKALLGLPELYRLEAAEVYLKLGNIPLMMEEYWAGISSGAILMENLEENLSSVMEDSSSSAKIGQWLLDKIKKNPNSESLTELLTWFYIQQKNFMAAFIQRKAQDKKQQTEGGRVLELARIAMGSDALMEAKNMVAYVTGLGENGRWFEEARALELDILRKIMLSGQYSQQDLQELAAAFRVFIERRGINNQTARIVMELARLEAHYLNKLDTAIMRLEPMTENTRVAPQIRAECKLLLGDLYLQSGDFYTPVLLYGQVDVDFKEDAMGREAKFRNARLSYYKGEFEWAKAQLDVLKTATSQLISNDAIALSLKIQENTDEDSTQEALKIFAQAELFYFRREYNKAWALLDTILKNFPEHPLTDNIWMTKALIRKDEKKYDEALRYFEEVFTKFSTDVLADNAMMEAAALQENVFLLPSKALELYEKVMMSFPGSVFTVEATRKYRLLKQTPTGNP